jgi:hypothetical protein
MHAYYDCYPYPKTLLRQTQPSSFAREYWGRRTPVALDDSRQLVHYVPLADWQCHLLTDQGLVPMVRLTTLLSLS